MASCSRIWRQKIPMKAAIMSPPGPWPPLLEAFVAVKRKSGRITIIITGMKTSEATIPTRNGHNPRPRYLPKNWKS